MFRRGDVRPANETIERNYTLEQVRETLRLPASERPYYTPGFPLSLALRHRMRIRLARRAAHTVAEAPEPEETSPISSDTAELAGNPRRTRVDW